MNCDRRLAEEAHDAGLGVPAPGQGGVGDALEDHEEALAGMAERVEGASLDQRLQRPLVEHRRVDPVAEVGEGGEGPVLLPLGHDVGHDPLADVAAREAAPLGALFTALALVTGSLWGKPMWGTYWVWDARLTSFLLLFFLYVGYIALWNAIDDPVRAAKAAAILSLVGAADVPIIHFSVDWWNTLHQPASIIRLGNRILFSNPYNLDRADNRAEPGKPRDRRKVSVQVS